MSSFTTPTSTLRNFSKFGAAANCSCTWDMMLKTSIAAASPFRFLALRKTRSGLLEFCVLSAYSSGVGSLLRVSSGGSGVVSFGGTSGFSWSSSSSNSQMIRSGLDGLMCIAHQNFRDRRWGDLIATVKTSGPLVATSASSSRIKSIWSSILSA